MYNLIWRSVTCRPGNGGLLSGVKRPIIAHTIATARRCDPIKDHTIASIVPPIGLSPHSGTTLAILSHPDCRSVLTLIVAGQRAGQSTAASIVPQPAQRKRGRRTVTWPNRVAIRRGR